MIIAYVSVVVALVGLLMFALAANPKKRPGMYYRQ